MITFHLTLTIWFVYMAGNLCYPRESEEQEILENLEASGNRENLEISESLENPENVDESEIRSKEDDFLDRMSNDGNMILKKLMKTSALLYGLKNMSIKDKSENPLPTHNVDVVGASSMSEMAMRVILEFIFLRGTVDNKITNYDSRRSVEKDILEIIYLKYLSFKSATSMVHCMKYFDIIVQNNKIRDLCTEASYLILSFHIDWSIEEEAQRFPVFYNIIKRLKQHDKQLEELIQSMIANKVNTTSERSSNETLEEDFKRLKIQGLDNSGNSEEFLGTDNIMFPSCEALMSFNEKLAIVDNFFEDILNDFNNTPRIEDETPHFWINVAERALELCTVDGRIPLRRMRAFVFDVEMDKNQILMNSAYTGANFKILNKSKRLADFTILF